MNRNSCTLKRLVAVVGLGMTASITQAQFSDSFEDGNGATRYDYLGFYEAGIDDGVRNFGFDYVAAGVPLAPNSTAGDSLGLYVQSNVTDDCSGGAVTPGANCDGSDNEGETHVFYPKTGGNFGANDDYILQFDFYAYVENTGNVFSMTERVSMGINADTSDTNWFFSPGPTSGSWFSMNLDGDSSSDIRALEGDPTGLACNGSCWREIVEDDNVEPLLDTIPGTLQGSLSAANPVLLTAISSGWSVFQVEKSGDTVTWRIDADPENANGFNDLVSFNINDPIVSPGADSFNITPDSGSDFDSGNVWFGYGDYINSVMDFGEIGGIFDNVQVIASGTPLVGDLDGDGFVGIDDLNLVLGNWNQNVPPANPLADPSGDGFIGIDDLNQVLGNWNAGTPPNGGAAVPEPTTLALLGLGGIALMRRK